MYDSGLEYLYACVYKVMQSMYSNGQSRDYTVSIAANLRFTS